MEFQPVESNLRASFRILAGGRPRGEVREIAGISIASAGVTFQMFNAAFLAAPVASDVEMERRLLVGRHAFRPARPGLGILELRRFSGRRGAAPRAQTFRTARRCISPPTCRA